jgi:hypothetical protein
MNESATTSLSSLPVSSNGERSFPRTLFKMLETAESTNFNDIVAWQQDGKSFKVFQPKEFAATIMHQYFNQSRYKSFQRQLNIYGFQRIHYGPHKGGYSHPCLNKSKPELCRRISRLPEKQKAARKRSKKSITRNFSFPEQDLRVLMDNLVCAEDSKKSFPFGRVAGSHDIMGPEPIRVRPLHVDDHTQIMDPSEAKILTDIFGQQSSTSSEKISSSSSPIYLEGSQESWIENDIIPLEPAPINLTEMIDIDDDIIIFATLLDDDVQADQHPSSSSSSSEHAFPWRLHSMLDDAQNDGFQEIVSWVQDGAAFKVHDSDEFVKQVMPNYFDQTKYESFRRQLNMYGFTRANRGEKRGLYFHELFLESDRRLCRNITRLQASSNKV